MSALLGWIVIPTFTWRGMFVIGGVGALITRWLRRNMPESPKWLESRGRNEEAQAILRRIEEENGASSQAADPTPAVAQTGAVADEKVEWVPGAIMSGYVVGPLLCAFFADRLGRRGTIAAFGTLAAAFAAVYPFMTVPALVIAVASSWSPWPRRSWSSAWARSRSSSPPSSAYAAAASPRPSVASA
jgi:putative MFS transporter